MPESQPEQKYKEAFGLYDPKSQKARLALQHALDIRKFEIELYWRRTTYFSAFISVAFAGYFYVISNKNEDNFYAFAIACIGFFLSCAWWLVNKGSKFWHQNWENHVDLLEDNLLGPLYKTVLCHRDNAFKSFSVSKINECVSISIMFIWVILGGVAMFDFDLLCAKFDMRYIAVIFWLLITCIFTFASSRSTFRDYDFNMKIRKSRIVDR